MSTRVVFLAAALSALAEQGFAAPDPLVERARQSHVASLAAITTFAAKVEHVTSVLPDADLPPSVKARGPIPDRKLRGEFWRSGQRIRISQTEGGAQFDLIKDLRAKRATLLPRGAEDGKRRPAVGVGNEFAFNSPLDLDDGILFCLPRPVPPQYEAYTDLDRAISLARKVDAKVERLDGVETVRLDLDIGGRGDRIEVWLAPGVNYLLKRVLTTIGGTPQLDLRVTDFREVKPGVFCPTRVERTVPRASKSVITLTDIRVNEPIPEGIFGTRAPAGAILTDHTEGKVYEIGPSGKPERVVGRIVQPEPTAEGSPSSRITPLDADEPPRASWPRLLLWASALSAVVAIVAWYYRRRVARVS